MADEALLAQGLCMRTLVIGYCALLDACDVVLGLLSAERTQRARGQMAGPSPASSKLSQCGLFVNILIQPFDQFRHNASGAVSSVLAVTTVYSRSHGTFD